MEEYEKLLDKAYKEVKSVQKSSDRFEVPKAEGQVSGNSTILTNAISIAACLRRPIEHFAKFLQKELAVFGRLDNGRLIESTKKFRNTQKSLLYVMSAANPTPK